MSVSMGGLPIRIVNHNDIYGNNDNHKDFKVNSTNTNENHSANNAFLITVATLVITVLLKVVAVVKATTRMTTRMATIVAMMRRIPDAICTAQRTLFYSCHLQSTHLRRAPLIIWHTQRTRLNQTWTVSHYEGLYEKFPEPQGHAIWTQPSRMT